MDLNIPQQTDDGADRRHLVEPRQTGAWIEDLPLANIGETARRVYTAVTEFNRIAMPDLNRIKVAEQLREPVGFIAQNLQSHYTDAAFPLRPRIRKIALLNRALHAELATAYKIILAGRSKQGPPRSRSDRKLLAIAGVRALRAMESLLLHTALVYEPPPEGTWREIHRIFDLLEEAGLNRVAVKDDAEPGRGSVTLEDLYRRSLLFALVPPYRMRQREMVALRGALPDWGVHTALAPMNQARPGERGFVIDPAADEPATYRTITADDPGTPARVFRTEPLALRLRRLVEEADNTDDRTLGGALLPKPLLRQLTQAWASAPERQFVRTRLSFDLELTIGLDDVHELLRSLAAEPPSAPAEESLDGDDGFDALSRFTATLSDGGSPFGLDIQELDIQEEDSVFIHAQSTRLDNDSAPSWSSAPGARDAPRIYRFRTLNESAGGYCISWQGEEVPRVKVGEIIGVRSVRSPSQFAVGVIRWMRNRHDDGHQLGIEMLASESSAVDVKPPGRSGEAARRALLLPAPQEPEGPPSLLVPPLVFKAGESAQLIERGAARKVRLVRLVETTGAFSRFDLEDLDRPATRQDSPEQPFDNLWDSL